MSSELRTRREAAGLTIEKLAALADVTSRTIWNAENEIGEPRRDTQKRILAALDIPFKDREEVFG